MNFSKSLWSLAMVAFLGAVAPAAEPVEIVAPGYLKRDLYLLPDGETLVFAEAVSSANLTMRAVKLSDKSLSLYQKTGRELSMSADGNVVAHTQGDGLNCQVDVQEKKRGRAFSIRSGFVSAPAVSPDGRTVVVMADFGTLFAIDLATVELTDAKKKQATQVVELKKEGKNETPLPRGVTRLSAPGVNGDYAPVFSPDGKQVVFASRRDNDYEIYRMNADGSDVIRLTNSPGIDNQPVYSPDGKQIAFTSNRDLNYEIYVMNADGSNVRRVTNHTERDDFACWSKDGRSLFFVGERSGKFGIFRTAVP